MTAAKHAARRRGFSLMEVIACTVIVALMIVPVAGVIRASGQSIARSEGDASTQARLRTSLRWVAQAIRENDVLNVRNRRVTLAWPDASVRTIEVRRGKLVLRHAGSDTVLDDDVRDIRFSSLRGASPPNSLHGIAMTLRARDPATRLWISVDAVVAQSSHR